ncbi:ATP-binding protein [Flavobacterium sp. N502540]|uniref:ATP-binding protein n=1 Tax=Flavobacterium sp. N502540 TaxID=2986838 RepID=UPI0022245E57|nr:ATP-binding protein [Flavobacterium sp. N502540]
MKFLVISGAPQTGKTTSINKIAEWLTTGLTADINGKPFPSFLINTKGKYNDFSIVINRHGRKIIIHSATDDEHCMDDLLEKLKKHPDTEVVITSCRDIDKERTYFTTHIKPYATFFLESPLGKINRKNKDRSRASHKWYGDTLLLLHQHILSNNPYNL